MAAVPPGLRYRLRDALALVAGSARVAPALDAIADERLARLYADGEAWLGADPSLAEVGAWMIDARNAPALRRRGCAWLALFPTVDAVQRLAALAADPGAPFAVREAAIAALGDRELRGKHAATRWDAHAIQLADEALVRLADAATAAGAVASEALPIALRHVQWEGAFAAFARKPGLWGAALECYASPALARVLLVCLEDIPPPHRTRALWLVAAVLGDEAVPTLLARAARAAPADAVELHLAIVALAGEVALGGLEDALRGHPEIESMRRRAKWHLAHRGAVPTVRALRVARATAVLAPDDRARLCGDAADDLAAQARFARFDEPELYAAWAWLARGSGDPARCREIAHAHAASQPIVGELYLIDLARRGKLRELARASRDLAAIDQGALQLAIWGRPFAALALAESAEQHSAERVVARALGCLRAGRGDLALRILAEDLPPAEIVDEDGVASAPAFPGPHEQWLAANAPDARPAVTALVAALADGGASALAALGACGKPAPFDAEPDLAAPDAFAPIAALSRRLARGLRGATVYLAGDVAYAAKGTLAAAIERAGARLVGAPYPGTDFYIAGDACPPELAAQLERLGARRLRDGELA